MSKTALIILDGWGHGQKNETDGVFLAKTPFMDQLYKNHPNSELITFGEDVGLPEGQMGNSEVGHMNLGAGRVVYQDLVKINKSIASGSFQENQTLLKAFQHAEQNGSAIHLIGLVSDGGVHSHLNHAVAIAEAAKSFGIKNELFLHAITDGRDTDTKAGLNYLSKVIEDSQNTPLKVASVIGRYYAMDRDNRWERVKKAYDLCVKGSGAICSDPLQAIKNSYENNITDEFIEPAVICNSNNEPIAIIKPNDVVICFNFRTDRCREITKVLSQEDMLEFEMQKLDLHYVTMTKYDDTFSGVNIMFEKDNLSNTLGEVLSKNGRTQLRIAETEKYPHVSFFFNGGREEHFKGEDRIMKNSPKVATYDLQPEMSAFDIKDAVINYTRENEPDFICLNFANGDMVGHTGVKEAIIKACETVDHCLKEICEELEEKNYNVIVIADHGNADLMENPDGTPHTAHTLNMVPCILISKEKHNIKQGKLADIAPTILDLMSIEIPSEMTGISLIS